MYGPGLCAAPLGSQSFRSWSIMASATVDVSWLGMTYVWPLPEVVYGYQEISLFPVTLWEIRSDFNCNSFEGCFDVVLVHRNPNSGSGPGLAIQLSHC